MKQKKAANESAPYWAREVQASPETGPPKVR